MFLQICMTTSQAWFDFYTWIWFLTANNPPFWCPNKRYQTENFRLVSKCQFVGLRTPFILPFTGHSTPSLPNQGALGFLRQLQSISEVSFTGSLQPEGMTWDDLPPKYEETREPKDLNHVFFWGGCHSTDTMTMTKTWEMNYNWWAFIFKYHAIAYLLSFWSGVSRATLTWKASIAELSDEETITQCIECLLPSISEYTSPHLSSKWIHIAHLSELLQVLPNLLKIWHLAT